MARVITLAAVLALIFADAGHAALPDKFDLKCSGSTRINDRKGRYSGPSWHDRMRFDLTSRRWCGGSCATADGNLRDTGTDVLFTASDDTDDTQMYFVHMTGTFSKRTLAMAMRANLKVNGVKHNFTQLGQCLLRPYTDIPK